MVPAVSVGQAGQHRRRLPTAELWLGEDGAGGADPGGGVVRGDLQGAAEQRSGAGVAVGGGDPAGVDLPGQLDLRGEGEPGDAFQGRRELQQRGLVEVREFGAGQRPQGIADGTGHGGGLLRIGDRAHTKEPTTWHRQCPPGNNSRAGWTAASGVNGLLTNDISTPPATYQPQQRVPRTGSRN